MNAPSPLPPPPDPSVYDAVAALRAGQPIGLPTETVYGLAADARSERAIQRVFALKQRPAHNPLIVHVLSVDDADAFAVLDPRARALAKAFWPGPLTLVLPERAQHRLAPSVQAGLATVAVRVPAHPVARAVLGAFAGPLAAPSANRSGEPSPTRREHVLASLGADAPLVLDGGPAHIGLESTIVHLAGRDATLLRPGAVSRAQLEAVLGPIATSHGDAERPSAPGQLLRHYAPRARVRRDARDCGPGEAWLGFGPGPAPHNAVLAANLSASGDVDEAARNLYHLLRALDAPHIRAIAVAPVPCRGLGVALNERLERAASERP